MNQNENNHSVRDKNSSENGLELLKVTRGSFRTPISGAGTATAQIDDQLFDVENIAPRGIGIRVAHADMFSLIRSSIQFSLFWKEMLFI